MPPQDRLQVARDSYGAYVSADRGVIEALLTEDFRFSGDRICRAEVYFGWNLRA